MTEPIGTPPQEPPSGPSTPSPEMASGKKKTSPWVWVAVGCLGILILIGGACAVTSFFVAKKVKDVTQDFEENPARAAAEMVIKLNPDLELVDSDDETGTLTVRNTKTGEEATFDYSEISEGRFSFKTAEGEVSFDAEQAGEGGMFTVETEEGETRFGAGDAAEDLPGWVPLYPDATSSEAGFTSRSADQVAGVWALETDDDLKAVKLFYETRLEDEGYQVTVQTSSGPQGDTAFVSGQRTDPDRQITVSLGREGETTTVAIQYSGQS